MDATPHERGPPLDAREQLEQALLVRPARLPSEREKTLRSDRPRVDDEREVGGRRGQQSRAVQALRDAEGRRRGQVDATHPRRCDDRVGREGVRGPDDDGAVDVVVEHGAHRVREVLDVEELPLAVHAAQREQPRHLEVTRDHRVDSRADDGRRPDDRHGDPELRRRVDDVRLECGGERRGALGLRERDRVVAVDAAPGECPEDRGRRDDDDPVDRTRLELGDLACDLGVVLRKPGPDPGRRHGVERAAVDDDDHVDAPEHGCVRLRVEKPCERVDDGAAPAQHGAP